MANKHYWLAKTEPDLYPISSLKKDKVTQWTDIRNYAARIHLRAMQVGDEVLIYHSNAKPTAIAGIATVSKLAYPDPGQFDKKSEYYDAKATKDEPRWFAPDLRFKTEFAKPISVDQLKKEKSLKNMVLFKISRLSVQPVTPDEFECILKLAD